MRKVPGRILCENNFFSLPQKRKIHILGEFYVKRKIYKILQISNLLKQWETFEPLRFRRGKLYDWVTQQLVLVGLNLLFFCKICY